MTEIKIALCEDNELYRNEFEKMIFVYANEYDLNLSIKIWKSAADFLDAVKQKETTCDILFLDIDMPELGGTEPAEIFRRMGKTITLCFVSDFQNCFLNTSFVDNVGYFIKPFRYSNLKERMRNAEMDYWYRVKPDEAKRRYLEIKYNRRNDIIDLEKVIYIEKRQDQCVFHLTDREQVCYDTFRNIYKQLDHQTFMRIHYNYIVNFNHVKDVADDRVYFGDGREAPLSLIYYRTVEELNARWRASFPKIPKRF